MPRDEYDYDYNEDVDTGAFDKRAANQQLGGRTSVAVPQGLSLWRPKRIAHAAHTIDIIPYIVSQVHLTYLPKLHVATPGRPYWERTYYSHRQIGVGEDKYVCALRTFGKPCPICEAAAEFKKSPQKEDIEQAKVLKPSERQLWLVIDNDEPDRGVQLWDESNWNFGRHLMNYIRSAPKNVTDQYKLFWHPLKGFTLRIACNETIIGKGKNYEYTVHSMYPRPAALPSTVINHGYDLDAMVVPVAYDVLKGIYSGVPAGSADDDDDSSHNAPEEVGDESPARPQYPAAAARNAPPARNNGAAPSAAATHSRAAASRPAVATPRSATPRSAPASSDQTAQFASLDTVSFTWKGVEVHGQVQRVDHDRQMLHVAIEGTGESARIPFEEAQLINSDDTFDLKNVPDSEPAPAKPARPSAPDKPVARSAAGQWDDDEPDERSAAAPKKKR